MLSLCLAYCPPPPLARQHERQEVQAVMRFSEKEAAAGLHPPPPGAPAHRAASAPRFGAQPPPDEAADFPLTARGIPTRAEEAVAAAAEAEAVAAAEVAAQDPRVMGAGDLPPGGQLGHEAVFDARGVEPSGREDRGLF